MAKKNGVNYRRNIVPASKNHIKSPYTMVPKKITYHNTDNQATANAEINYMVGNSLVVSYHLAVDEKEAIQGLSFSRNGFHAGDGGRGYGNRQTIGIEICRNYDRSRNTTNLNEPLRSQYSQAEINAIKVGAAIMYEEGIAPIRSNIKYHTDWARKNCPSKILNEKRGEAFKDAALKEAIRYRNEMEGKGGSGGGKIDTGKPSTSKPSFPTTTGKTIKELVAETLAGKHGNGEARKKSLGKNFAEVQGIINGTSSSKTPTVKPTNKTIERLVAEVMAGKHGNGEARKKSLGKDFKAVQDAINKGSTGSTSKPSTSQSTIDRLVAETLAGKHGNGATRKKSLGKHYSEVQSRINGGSKGKAPSKPSGPSKSTIDRLVAETLAGKHGNGADRKKSLGSNFKAVQDAINKGSKGKISTSKKPSTSVSTIDRLVAETLAGKHGNGAARKRSLGSNFKAVQDAINKGSKGKTAPKSTKPSKTSTINRLVKETMAGKHGNGAARKKSLGSYYDEVQKIINKK